MAEQTSSSITIAAAPATVMAVIADFESYPDWATGVKEADVLSTDSDGRAQQVKFVLNAPPIKDTYTLEYNWTGDKQVSWKLVEASVLKALDGQYALTPAGEGQTEVTYQLRVDVAIPMIGMLKRRAEKVIIDTALKGLKQRVETGA
ncbi:MAG: SRPBCC family protein [Actinomycetota bacterium]|nr:SRPBCC family protein [Actinomycetota bacterium]